MARNDPQVNLRMPAELKAALDKAAEKSKRSLTAEIVARLTDSLVSPTPDDGPIFNIVLDAKGHPIDWPTITAHISRTAKAAGIDTASIRAAIFNPGPPLKDPEAIEYLRLVRWYQAQTRKYRDGIQSEGDS